jgi:2-iminoacetate synthase
MNKIESENEISTWLDTSAIEEMTKRPAPDIVRFHEILTRAASLSGLTQDEVADLLQVESTRMLDELFEAAACVKEAIYGPRIVFFAPLYISNICANECSYCAFRSGNKIERRTLTNDQIIEETKTLIEQGHKRILLVAGEDKSPDSLDRIVDAVHTIYSVKLGGGEIRRINVNIAPLSASQFARLKSADIGTYQLFQETYHRPTYEAVHRSGRKRNYSWRLNAIDRAMDAGIDDVGIGPLLGLYDWKFETLAMMQHIAHLEESYGVGPHTISLPRLEPAAGSCLSERPPHPVSDRDFLKLIAILRLAVPYTGIILSTREGAEIRRQALALGVSQLSAGSRTDIGGYSQDGDDTAGQFQLGDHRSLDEVVRDVASMGYVPSFCTACYRKGRTGKDFMDLAKPGKIKSHCEPNAVTSFLEYIEDYASPLTAVEGNQLIKACLSLMEPNIRELTFSMIEQIKSGKRDIYV